MKRYDLVDDVVHADALLMVLTSVSRALMMEKSLGVTSGHKSVRALLLHYLYGPKVCSDCARRIDEYRRGLLTGARPV